MMQGYFRNNKKYSYYYVYDGKNETLFKYTYNANTVSSLSYLMEHTNTKPINIEVFNTKNPDNIVPIYTLIIYYQGTQKPKKAPHKKYDKKLPLMTKNQLLKKVNEYKEYMTINDEMYIYKTENNSQLNITAIQAFIKTINGFERKEL